MLRWTEWWVPIHRLPGCAAGTARRTCESNVAVALVWLALVAMHIEKCFAFMRCAGFDV